jgi:hypothetical protein
MSRKPRPRPGDDLFELFPDLPRPVRRADSGRREQVLKLAAAAGARAAENAQRQLRASARVREALAARQQGKPRRRLTFS